MRKLGKFLLAAVIALGFAACNNKEDVPNTGGGTTEGTTYMSVSFRIDDGVMTRAEDGKHNTQGNWEGRDKFNNVSIYLVEDNKVSLKEMSMSELTRPSSAQDGVYATQPWKTTAGEKTVYVVLNNNGAIKVALDGAMTSGKTAFDAAYKNAYEMLSLGKVNTAYAKVDNDKKDVILMTGYPTTQIITDGVKAIETATKNRVKVSLRRVVSRVAVSMNKTLDYSENSPLEVKTKEDVVIGHLKNLAWTPMQYEVKSNLLWQAIDGSDSYTADLVKSWPDAFAYVPNNNFKTEASKYYDYTRKTEALPIRTDFERTTQEATIAYITDAEKNNMEFITETTHTYGVKLDDGSSATKTGYRRGNSTYVMVTGTFAPAEAAWANDTEKDEYASRVGADPNATIDLYWGVVKGKFYVDEARAKADNPIMNPEPGQDGIIKYTAGKMYYFAWVNPNTNQVTTWVNSPVVRNNIYHVNIAGFENIGLYHNPYDPNDPGDDDDPDPKDPDDPLYDTETFMITEITVINWGMHSYDITF